MADAIRQLQRVTTGPSHAGVHLMQLAERGCVTFTFPDGYANGSYYRGIVPVIITRQPECAKTSDLNKSERLVLKTLFGTTLEQQSVTLAAYKFPQLDKQLRALATEEFKQKRYIEPSSLIPRVLLAAAAVAAIGAIAISLWNESPFVSCLLALFAVFAVVVIAKEPRGWRLSQLGAQVLTDYTPPSPTSVLSAAVRYDHTVLNWDGFQKPQQPAWLSGAGLWGDNVADNMRNVSALILSINVAASPPPPPPKTATGQA